ncbi:acyltransferase family protein [Pseudarthrobacter albicanus]|uniref:acyltransferase family protein n=1 Tax=Pseudarthrobacter albicanus TaxID=2823873 RepID=UPI001BAAA46D|nr:acyltransferase [Pseudarthrobacter albicanus]
MRASDAPIHDGTKLPALTGLRFLAAAAVIVCHFNQRGTISVPLELTDFLDDGRTAVALFFVLSGFILTYNYSNMAGVSERVKFYASRIARIYPVTILALLLAAGGVGYAVINRDAGVLTDWYALEDANIFTVGGSLLAQLTMTTGWFPTASINQPWNAPAWSIACEMFFYALFPFLIVRMRRLSPARIAIILEGCFALQCFIIWAARTFAPIDQKGFLVYQFPVTHLFEFLAGITAGLIFLRGGREWIGQGARRNLLLAGSLVPLAALAYLRPVNPAYLLMSPLFAVLILTLAVAPARRPSWLAWRPLVVLGEASFSLYMIHVPLRDIYTMAQPTVPIGWCLLAATIVISVLVFKYFETPARYRFRAAILQRWQKAPATLVGTQKAAD